MHGLEYKIAWFSNYPFKPSYMRQLSQLCHFSASMRASALLILPW